eukprot:GDKJ01049867.1.p1 GENE.GDKJ01049867.1~~GDKJ01049867.1.p1  ORF type:complete len:223 (-),score=36.19 GDKJ01049867.1:551-1219(-)
MDEVPQETTFRDSRGKIISENEWKSRDQRQKNPEPQKKQELFWSRGLAQIEAEKIRLIEEEELMNSSFTRRELDPSLDEQLKKETRDDDPMAQIADYEDEFAILERKRQRKQHRVRERSRSRSPISRHDQRRKHDEYRRKDRDSNHKKTEDKIQQNIDSNFQEVEKYPNCPYAAPTNRFGIKAGYRWDGVIRGNAFEDKLLTTRNAQQAQIKESTLHHLRNL